GFQAFRTTDVFEHDIRTPADVLHQPRLNDVAVLFQPNPRHGFLHETGDGAFVGQEAALERLQGDRLALFVVVAKIDDTHTAAPHVGDLIAVHDAVADAELVAVVGRPCAFRLAGEGRAQ